MDVETFISKCEGITIPNYLQKCNFNNLFMFMKKKIVYQGLCLRGKMVYQDIRKSNDTNLPNSFYRSILFCRLWFLNYEIQNWKKCVRYWVSFHSYSTGNCILVCMKEYMWKKHELIFETWYYHNNRCAYRKQFTTVINYNFFMTTSMFLRRHFNIIITSVVQLVNYFNILYD